MSTANTLSALLLWAPPVILAITVHEMGHGWAASRLGDPTAAEMGRLSANPLRHLDPVGSLLVPLLLWLSGAGLLFGWAKPVPVDWRNLRRPRRDMALVALAGPGANLAMLLGWALCVRLGAGLRGLSGLPGEALISMGEAGIIINSALIAFNLLPLPPLDGSRVLSALLPRELARRYNRLEPYGLVILIVLLALGLLDDLLRPLFLATEWLRRMMLAGLA